MDKLSRKLIALIILVPILFLVGCAPIKPEINNPSPVNPSDPSPSKSPASTPTLLPTENPTALQATEAEATKEQPASISDLDSSPLLAPDNVTDLTILGEQHLDPGNEVYFSHFDWSDDGSRIVVCAFYDPESSYLVYDLLEKTKLAQIPVSDWTCANSLGDDRWLQFSRDGNLFSGLIEKDYPDGGRYNTPAVFRTQSGEVGSILAAQPADVRYPPEVVFSSLGTRLAISTNYASSSDYDPNYASVYILRSVGIDLFDVQTGDHWGTFRRYSDKYVTDLEYSTKGQYLVVGTGQTAEAWDVKGGLVYTVDCPNALITFSPAAESAAVTCGPSEGDSYQLLWDLVTGDVLPISDAPGNYSRELKFSMDGRLLLGLSDRGKISIWNGETGRYLATLPETFSAPLDVNFTGNGRLVAVLLGDGRLKLYGVK